MTRQITVGKARVGGGAPVSIQSMLNTPTTDVEACLAQIAALEAAGCDIVRLAVPNRAAAEGFGAIATRSPLPLVADIHFDYRLPLPRRRRAPPRCVSTPAISVGRAGSNWW